MPIFIKPTSYSGISIQYDSTDPFWLMNVEDGIRMLASNSHSHGLLKSFAGLTPTVKLPEIDAIALIVRPLKSEFNMPGFARSRVLKTPEGGLVVSSFSEKREQNEWRLNRARLQIAHDTKICCSAVSDEAAQDTTRGSCSYVRFANIEILSSTGEWRNPYIGLAHELIHALHNAQGKQKDPYIREEEYTVGINGFEDEPLTENSIRRKFGLPKRVAY